MCFDPTFALVILVFAGADISLLRRKHRLFDQSTRDGGDVGTDDVVAQKSDGEAKEPSKGVDLEAVSSVNCLGRFKP